MSKVTSLYNVRGGSDDTAGGGGTMLSSWTNFFSFGSYSQHKLAFLLGNTVSCRQFTEQTTFSALMPNHLFSFLTKQNISRTYHLVAPLIVSRIAQILINTIRKTYPVKYTTRDPKEQWQHSISSTIMVNSVGAYNYDGISSRLKVIMSKR